MIGTKAIATLTVATLICACASDAPDRDRFTVRDSAGIHIVESAGPAWSEADAWRLGEQPQVDIGGLEGDPDYELFHVSNAVRMPDGRIVIGSRGSNQLRFYDSAGRHLLDAGGDGEGPGEFRDIRWVRLYRSDSVAAYDRRLTRISVFDSQGRFARSFAIPPMESGGTGLPDDVFEDGSVMARAASQVPPDADGEVVRRVEPRYSVSPEGEFEDSLCAYPGTEVVMHSFESMSLVYFGSPLFGRSTYYDVAGNRIYVAPNDTYEIRIHARDGSLESIVRKQHEQLDVTDADVEALKEQQLSGNMPQGMRDAMVGILDDTPIRETMPAFDSVMVDRVGNLWVEEYRRPGDTLPRWTVFNRDGELLGTLSLPDGFVIYDVGDDYVLGKWSDEMDIEHVQLYGLIKP